MCFEKYEQKITGPKDLTKTNNKTENSITEFISQEKLLIRISAVKEINKGIFSLSNILIINVEIDYKII